MREIPSFPGYFATIEGRIINKKGKVMRPHKRTTGYFQIPLRVNGQYKTRLVHRLVAEAFLGPSDLSINHKDGVKDNNHIDNLEYVTRSENTLHAYNVLKVKLKPVQLTRYGIGYWWPSQRDCKKDTGLTQQEVSMLALGVRKSAKDYKTTMFTEIRK